MSCLSPIGLLAILLAVSSPAFGQKERVEEIATRGQAMRVLLIRPEQPVGSVILLAGGHGNLSLSAAGELGWGAGNQVVRTRNLYAKAGFVTATPDIAPDLKQGSGGAPGYRWSDEHAADIGALIAHLRGIARPVYLVGTSRGAISAVNAAVKLPPEMTPDAIVVTSGMLVHIEGNKPSAEKSVGHLERIRQPVLIVYHERDECPYTPAASAERFRKLLTASPKVDVRLLSGGSAAGDPCEARHYHGFQGLDAEVVRITTDWLKALRK